MRNFTFNIFRLTVFSVLFITSVFADESVPEAHLSEILSPKLLQSVNHRVDEVVVDGQFYRFHMESDFGSYNIASMAMLRTRVSEITTLGHAMNEFSRKNERLSDELRGQFRISADSAIDIITRPVSSAADIAGQFANNLEDTLTGVPALTKQPVYYDAGESSDPTTMMHKRNVASQWQLDVYSSNARVQDFLNTVAKTRASGRISAGAPAIGRRLDPSMKIADLDLELDIAYLLKSKTPEELTFINQGILENIGIEAETRESFLKHPAFSPRHKTTIIHYLQTLSGVKNLSAFLRAALKVEDEHNAVALEQGAVILSHYHREIDSLQKLHMEKKLIQAINDSGRIINLLPVDIVYWSPSVEILFDKVLKSAQSAGFRSWELITSGSISQQARSELERRQFVLKEQFAH